MGYFALSVKNTVEDKLEAALANIKLWEELDEGGEYLISGLVKTLIEDALELHKTKLDTTAYRHRKMHYSQRYGEHVCPNCGESLIG